MTTTPTETEEPRPIVVCVDDDPDVLAGNARVLRLEHALVMATTSPSEVLRILSTLKVAVLVSDFEMPEMTGVELCAAARAASPETVRILLTGRGTFDTAVSGINEGEIFRFLSKPTKAERLRAEVRAAIERHRDLMSTRVDRNAVARRAELLRELEAEYPGITEQDLDEQGRYAVDAEAWRSVAGLGLEPIAALCAT